MIASQLATATYAEHFGALPALFEEVELGVLREQYARATSMQHRMRYGLTWLKHRHYVAELLRRFEVCTVVSARERDLVTAITHGAAPVEIIPNCVNLADYQEVQAPRLDNSLVFTGPFRYTANYDAMTWFLREVYPAIQAQTPDVTLTITGDHADLPLPPATNVTLTGQVPDVLPLVAGATCSIVPLQSGGGTRLKILEAMALGTPVVSTSKGAEGLDVQHDVHLLIADTPEEFAGAVIRLLQQPDLQRRLSGNALRLVREHYDWAGVMPRFLELVAACSPRSAGGIACTFDLAASSALRILEFIRHGAGRRGSLPLGC